MGMKTYDTRENPSMLRMLRSFFSLKVASPWLMLAGLVLASVSEGVGIAALLLVMTAIDAPQGEMSPAVQALTGAVESLGLSSDFRALLGLVIGALVLRSVLSLLVMRYVGRASADVAANLRMNLIRQVLAACMPANAPGCASGG